jgi:calcium-independent phospholipase A2
LYRCATQEEAEAKFEAFAHRLPIFVQIVKDVSLAKDSRISQITNWFYFQMFNVNGLQKICDALSENPSWSLAHLVAYFNLTEYVKHPKIIEFLDYPDHGKFMTPLQV